MKKFKLTMDKKYGVSYLKFLNNPETPGCVDHSEEIAPAVMADFDKDGNIIGLEFLVGIEVEEYE